MVEMSRRTQSLRNPLSLFTRKHHAPKLVVHAMAVIEPQTVLCDHIQLPSKRAPRFPVYRMCMARCMNVGARFMDCGVDREGCGVDRFVALDDFAGFSYEDQVRNADLREVCAKGVEP